MSVAKQTNNSSPLKRGYNSTNGPGGTEERPIVVEEDEDGGASHEVPTRPEKRHGASDLRREIDEDTAMADQGSGSDVPAEAASSGNQASNGPSAEYDVGASVDRQSMPSADAGVVEGGDASANEQNSTNTAGVDSSEEEEEEEEEGLDGSKADDPDEDAQEEPSQSMDPEAGHETNHSDPEELESVISSAIGQESIIDSQPAHSSSSDEDAADE